MNSIYTNVMNRIRKTFDRLLSERKKALIPYITPEFPFKGITVPLLRELEKSGADMIEVGIPFSDPLADGATIQRSSELALKNGASIPSILHAATEFRQMSEVPLILMGYINPILRFGMERFFEECSAAGVDGLIIADLPPEEAADVKKASAAHSISNVFLIAPTTSNERMKKIEDASTDFTYCVSVTGVTGARSQFSSNGSLEHFLQRVNEHTRKPFVVGFGISTSEHVKEVWSHADGAVVGSALIDVLSGAVNEKEALEKSARFLRSLRP
ncbi:MAG: tryptophan synthase subunit alpha [Ignavibacteriales bacterium]|nr:tryptophan synthase subunit alpha [Ignavibacteriales bacterium]